VTSANLKLEVVYQVRQAVRAVNLLLSLAAHSALSQVAHQPHGLGGTAAEDPLTMIGAVLKADDEATCLEFVQRGADILLWLRGEGAEHFFAGQLYVVEAVLYLLGLAAFDEGENPV
jgi:hypothetical protein